MKRYIPLICVSFFLHTILTGQIFIDEEITNKIYVGPKNVYPLSIEICQSYIAYLEDEKVELEEQINADHQKESILFNYQLDQFIADWRETKNRISLISENPASCYVHVVNDKSYNYHSFEIVHSMETDEIQVMEYIEPSILPLGEVKWEKRKMDNCRAPDPAACYVWCKVTTKKVYLDRGGNEIDTEILLSYEFSKEKDRLMREVIIEIDASESYILHNLETDAFYSIDELVNVGCE